MPYEMAIDRKNPTLLLYLVDQSGSMGDPYRGTPDSKAEYVAGAVNRHLMEVTLKAAKDTGMKDYFSIGVIGYGGAGVATGFEGALGGKATAWISEIAHSPLRIEERTKRSRMAPAESSRCG